MDKVTVLIGTIGDDSHVIGQWVVAKFLEERGVKVIKLGVCVSQQDFVNAALESDARAILVSSLYGMGYHDSAGLREKLVEAGKGDVLLYAGGLLAVGSEAVWDDVERKFRDIGFDRAYPRDVNLEAVLRDLRHDLDQRRPGVA